MAETIIYFVTYLENLQMVSLRYSNLMKMSSVLTFGDSHLYGGRAPAPARCELIVFLFFWFVVHTEPRILYFGHKLIFHESLTF